MDLKEIRDDIDKIDKQIIELFLKRMDTVLKVAEYKKENDIEVLNRKREEEIIERNLNSTERKEYINEVEKFLKSLMEISRQTQRKFLIGDIENTSSFIVNDESMKIDKDTIVGFQGIKGAYSEEALYTYFGNDIEAKSLNTFEDVFKALNNKEIDYGVVPIENSSTGGVLEVYDLFSKYEFSVVGEICVKVNHSLIGRSDAELGTIKEVYAHPQALSQSSEFLDKYNWRKVPYINNAKAVEYVKELDRNDVVAICGKRAARIYDLSVLEENINTNKTNRTRFLIISRKPCIDEECNKISIVFSIDHKIGCLYNVLKYFAENEVNMLKIESRPLKERPWEYVFYIDFEGNITNPKTKIALESIKDNTNYFRLIGNYKKDERIL